MSNFRDLADAWLTEKAAEEALTAARGKRKEHENGLRVNAYDTDRTVLVERDNKTIAVTMGRPTSGGPMEYKVSSVVDY